MRVANDPTAVQASSSIVQTKQGAKVVKTLLFVCSAFSRAVPGVWCVRSCFSEALKVHFFVAMVLLWMGKSCGSSTSIWLCYSTPASEVQRCDTTRYQQSSEGTLIAITE